MSDDDFLELIKANTRRHNNQMFVATIIFGLLMIGSVVALFVFVPPWSH